MGGWGGSLMPISTAAVNKNVALHNEMLRCNLGRSPYRSGGLRLMRAAKSLTIVYPWETPDKPCWRLTPARGLQLMQAGSVRPPVSLTWDD